MSFHSTKSWSLLGDLKNGQSPEVRLFLAVLKGTTERLGSGSAGMGNLPLCGDMCTPKPSKTPRSAPPRAPSRSPGGTDQAAKSQIRSRSRRGVGWFWFCIPSPQTVPWKLPNGPRNGRLGYIYRATWEHSCMPEGVKGMFGCLVTPFCPRGMWGARFCLSF